MLRKYAFIVAILGIAFLLGLLILPAKKIVEERSGLVEINNLEELEINDKVIFSGKVGSESDFGDFKIWKLSAITSGAEMDFDVVCDCRESYLGREVEIVGLVSEFNGERQVRVLRILTTS